MLIYHIKFIQSILEISKFVKFGIRPVTGGKYWIVNKNKVSGYSLFLYLIVLLLVLFVKIVAWNLHLNFIKFVNCYP